jgi:hypothetical protein
MTQRLVAIGLVRKSLFFLLTRLSRGRRTLFYQLDDTGKRISWICDFEFGDCCAFSFGVLLKRVGSQIWSLTGEIPHQPVDLIKISGPAHPLFRGCIRQLRTYSNAQA